MGFRFSVMVLDGCGKRDVRTCAVGTKRAGLDARGRGGRSHAMWGWMGRGGATE